KDSSIPDVLQCVRNPDGTQKSGLWIVGDLDSYSPQDFTDINLEKLGFRVHKTVDNWSTDFEKTFRFMLEQKSPEILSGDILVVDGVFGGRFDQTMSSISTLYRFHTAIPVSAL